MAHHIIKKRRYKNVPGTIVQCQSGRYLAFYEHRTDIVANGDNEVQAKKILKKMYETVLKHEKKEEEKSGKSNPLHSFKTKQFSEKLLTS